MKLKPWQWPPFRECDDGEEPIDGAEQRWVDLRQALEAAAEAHRQE
jgi:hypothetical protein